MKQIRVQRPQPPRKPAEIDRRTPSGRKETAN